MNKRKRKKLDRQKEFQQWQKYIFNELDRRYPCDEIKVIRPSINWKTMYFTCVIIALNVPQIKPYTETISLSEERC